MITKDDVEAALRWLAEMERAARFREQKRHETEAARAAKVIRELTGR